MSQSPRKPQSKWGTPQEAPSGIPQSANLPPNAEVPGSVPTPNAEVPGAVSTPTAPAADPSPPAAVPSWPTPAQDAPVAVPGTSAPPSAAPAPAAVATSSPAQVAVAPSPGDNAYSLTEDPAFDDGPASKLTLKDRMRRLSPVYVTLTVVSIGAVIFLALAMTSHTTPVAVLMSAGVVTFLAFGLDAAICTVAAYGAGRREEVGRALFFALLGGVSAVICALAMAGTLILILVLAG